jgi:transposase
MDTKPKVFRSYCALDLHHSHTVFEAQTGSGCIYLHRDMPTEPRYLIEATKLVRGPKLVLLEEGAMADWAFRVLKPYATEVLVSDPRRNHLITQDGDKTDHVDPGKLIELYRSGSIRAVYHPDRQSIMDLRGWVWSYHDQVDLVIAAKNKIKALLRMMGVAYGVQEVYCPTARAAWLEQLPRRSVRDRMQLLYGNLDDLAGRRDQMHQRLCRIAHRHPVAKRFLAVPGYGPVRALTFLVMVDTPFRFSSPQKLWKYSGLGLRREQSGDPALERRYPPVQYNRRLKKVARGAMETVLRVADGNPFEVVYRHLLAQGLRDGLARLTVARKLLSVPWGMWKGGTDYDPALVTRG